ncbi:MAG: peptidase S8, partial [Myxococcales bacterium]
MPLDTVRVTVQDSFGNRVLTASHEITLAPGAGSPSGATLGGTKVLEASNGLAEFSDLTLDKVGSYTLTAAATGLTGATSSSFSIGAGAPSRLTFSVQPGNVTAGSNFSPALQVRIEDAEGNLTSSTAQVTLAVTGGGATVEGTSQVNAVNGVATFSSARVSKAGTWTLTASSGSLTTATSSSFSVSAGSASTLAFTTQPASALAGATLSAVAVTVRDAHGNDITGSTASITLAVGTGPSGATFSGTKTVDAVAGVASFEDLSLDKAGDYTLTASAAS